MATTDGTTRKRRQPDSTAASKSAYELMFGKTANTQDVAARRAKRERELPVLTELRMRVLRATADELAARIAADYARNGMALAEAASQSGFVGTNSYVTRNPDVSPFPDCCKSQEDKQMLVDLITAGLEALGLDFFEVKVRHDLGLGFPPRPDTLYWWDGGHFLTVI